jgi:integrase
MAWIKERPRKSGAISYLVMWRDADSRKSEALTFHDEGEARMLVRLLNANGQSFKIAQAGILKVHDQSPTLGSVMQQHISMLTRASTGTVGKYRAMMRDHIAPRIGYLPVTAVEYPHLTDWIKWMQSKGCSAKTIANVHGLISATMTTAIKLKLRPDNPCAGISLPRNDRTSDSASFLTHEEYELIYRNVRPHYQPFVQFLVATGLRFGEATALTVGDVNLLTLPASVRVEKAWKSGARGVMYIGPPKSAKARRTVSLPSALAEILRPLLAGRNDDELVFTSPAGGAIRSGGMHNWVWQPALKAAHAQGLRKQPRVHDLRHTHASWLVQEGVNIFTVSRRLGHESITTTLDRYSHVMPDALRDAAEATERAMTPRPPKIG